MLNLNISSVVCACEFACEFATEFINRTCMHFSECILNTIHMCVYIPKCVAKCKYIHPPILYITMNTCGYVNVIS